jgi:hypothetical protein
MIKRLAPASLVPAIVSMVSNNPYATPPVDFESSKPPKASAAEAKLSYAGWLGLVAINTPLPLLFALSIVRSWAVVGVALAFIPMLFIGIRICRLPNLGGKPIFVGGLLTALLQFLPILHIFIGMLAVQIAMSIDELLGARQNGEHEPFGFQLQTIPGAFIATCITGALLPTVATVLGYTIRFCTPATWWHRELSADDS